jgi:hypothetical protein
MPKEAGLHVSFFAYDSFYPLVCMVAIVAIVVMFVVMWWLR